MNTLPLDLENIIFKYEQQLRMKDVMEELLNVFPTLHFNCCICNMENISFVYVGCCKCKASICKKCMEVEVEDLIFDYRDNCDFYLPSEVNKDVHFRGVAEEKSMCNECLDISMNRNYFSEGEEVDYSDYSDDEMFL